jgi:hypothetical protein
VERKPAVHAVSLSSAVRALLVGAAVLAACHASDTTAARSTTTDLRHAPESCGSGDCNAARACEYLDQSAAASVLGGPVEQDLPRSRGYANADFCTYRRSDAASSLELHIGTPDQPEYARERKKRQRDEATIEPGAYSYVDDQGAHVLTLHRAQDVSVVVHLTTPGNFDRTASLDGARRLARMVLAAYDSRHPSA